MRLARVLLCFVCVTSTALAAPPEPSGPHPRMVLDAELKAAWKAQAAEGRGPVVGAIALCTDAAAGHGHDRALYQGAEWSKTLQACLVAWAATDSADHAATALRFFTALLDDLDDIGDGKGGDNAARRDDGYAIRNLGPFTAMAYDWLHDAPGMTPALREKARKRWQAWLAWYRDKGYRKRAPATNYQAGFLLAATLIAVAQGGEAANEGGAELWKFVADELWGKDMAAALASGGVLDGGDWPEGWQYGPLAVASYSLAARVAKRAGIVVEGVTPWLASLLRRHVYGLSAVDKVFPAGDTEHEEANLPPHVLTLDAIALGDANADDKRWAKGELSRLKLVDSDYLFYDALATVGDKPALAPRATWPTWYLAANTATIYARTRWDAQAVWFVAECAPTLLGADGNNIDHRHPNAGNFVLSRGKDDVIVDPSPYGALSTLTGNAPTVASGKLPNNYQPSQGQWGEKTGWDWATQTRSGVIAARCDYADQFKFQGRKSDIPAATRDFVLLPSADGTSTALAIVDRANTDSDKRGMYLRFRTTSALALAGADATGSVGDTALAILGISRTSGTPTIAKPTLKDCYAETTVRGKCDATRFPINEYNLQLDGSEPVAVHVIGATPSGSRVDAKPLTGDGYAGVRLATPRDAVVIWPLKPGELTYRAPKSKSVTHVIVDGPAGPDGKATVAAKADGADCTVTITAGGATPARPAVLTLDDACAVAVDPESPNAASAQLGKSNAITRPNPPGRRGGCCGAQSTPESPIALAIVVGAVVIRRRRRCLR